MLHRQHLVVLALLLAVVFSDEYIPPAWQSKIKALNAVYADDDTGRLQENGYPGIYLPLIGNGFVAQDKGVRSDTMFMSGIYNGETTSPSHRARIPAPFAVTLEHTSTNGVLFDLEHGTYTRRGKLPMEDETSTGWYELRWYAQRTTALRSLFVMEFTPHVDEPDATANVSMVANRGAASDDIAFEAMTPGSGLPTDGSVEVQCGNTLIPETPDGPVRLVCVVNTALPTSAFLVNGSDKDSNHQRRTYIAAFRSSLDVDISRGSTPLAAVQTAAEADYLAGILASSQGIGNESSLFSSHAAAWDDIWRAGIEVDGGRADLGLAINASLVALLSSVRADWGHEGGLAPGGLTNYYNGHSFWDTETWMYPPLLFLHPDISRSLIQYRYQRIEGAISKAASYSPPYSGTMFPWESASSGVETCPTFAATGLREQHINGDISVAIWQEWLLRADKDWLRNVGYPLLIGVADFWTSRVTEDTGTGSKPTYRIDDVIPPDEYVDHVNNSIYTNYVAGLSLRYAVMATEILGNAAECAQCPIYSTIADGLQLLFDDKLQIHPEYEGYSGEMVKQGDVVLLPYPLGCTSMSAEVRRNDLDYYAERTDSHGPAMTWGMFSIGYLDVGDSDNAARYLNMSFSDNMQPPLHVWTETPDGNACNFITGAGGFLQTMIMGYPGLRLKLDDSSPGGANTGKISFTPTCIPGVTHFRLRGIDIGSFRLNLEYWCSEVYSQFPVDARISLNEEFSSDGKQSQRSSNDTLWVSVDHGPFVSLHDESSSGRIQDDFRAANMARRGEKSDKPRSKVMMLFATGILI